MDMEIVFSRQRHDLWWLEQGVEFPSDLDSLLTLVCQYGFIFPEFLSQLPLSYVKNEYSVLTSLRPRSGGFFYVYQIDGCRTRHGLPMVMNFPVSSLVWPEFLQCQLGYECHVPIGRTLLVQQVEHVT